MLVDQIPDKSTVSVKIIGTLCYFLALSMWVCKVWWVNCDKQHWEGEETGQKGKKYSVGWKCPNYFCLILQSQSKLLGHFAVFLPSQCWCARFGELTAINNIVRRRKRTRSEKTVLSGSLPTIFVWDCRSSVWNFWGGESPTSVV